VEHEFPGRARDDPLDHLPRKQDPVTRLSRTAREETAFEHLGHVPHAELGEQSQGEVVDGAHVRVGERPVGTTDLPRRARIDGRWRAAHGDLGGTSAGTTGRLRSLHDDLVMPK